MSRAAWACTGCASSSAGLKWDVEPIGAALREPEVNRDCEIPKEMLVSNTSLRTRCTEEKGGKISFTAEHKSPQDKNLLDPHFISIEPG